VGVCLHEREGEREKERESERRKGRAREGEGEREKERESETGFYEKDPETMRAVLEKGFGKCMEKTLS